MGIFAAPNTYVSIRERDNNYFSINPGRYITSRRAADGGAGGEPPAEDGVGAAGGRRGVRNEELQPRGPGPRRRPAKITGGRNIQWSWGQR